MLKIAFHPSYVHPIRQGHRFPMLKYELIPLELLHAGLVEFENFFRPQPTTPDILELAHNRKYVYDVLGLRLDQKMVRRIGFPLTNELVEREMLLVQGTIDACEYARLNGVSFNLAGGTHHAGRDFGEGFCLFNDQAVAAAHLIARRKAERVLIIDLDVHQGNGTADIFQDKSIVFTFSMHAVNNFPFVKNISTRDVELHDGIEDEAYLLLLDENLEEIFFNFQPNFVFYQAGVDVLSTDKLGKLKLSADGCRRRDELVFTKCKSRGLPVQVSMGGGYSLLIEDTVQAHVATFKAASAVFGL